MSLAQDIEILKAIPTLADFADDQLRLLAFSAESQEYRAGSVLFNEGERSDGALVIAEGEVALQKITNGKVTQLDVVSAGTLLGETALLVDIRRPCRAMAEGPVRAIRIRRALFKRMIQEYPETAQRLYDMHVTRYTQTIHELAPIGQRLEELEALDQTRPHRAKQVEEE